jgi:XTP/dITP diphosphohydrolase
MSRKLGLKRLVVATHNPGKLREINDLLRPHGVVAVSAGSLGISEPQETEASFAGNAKLKALHSALSSGLPAIADDSGLCVDALGGEPGVHSARWAGPSKDFAMAMRNVEEKLQAKGAKDRRDQKPEHDRDENDPAERDEVGDVQGGIPGGLSDAN